MTLAAALSHGSLTTEERTRVRTAYDCACAVCREQGSALPTAMDVRVQLRKLGEHLATSSVRGLVRLLDVKIADGDA